MYNNKYGKDSDGKYSFINQYNNHEATIDKLENDMMEKSKNIVISKDLNSFNMDVNNLYRKLPRFCKSLASLQFDEALESMNSIPPIKSSFSVLDNISSPFLLLAICETLYYEFSFIESKSVSGNSLSEMYMQVLVDLDIIHNIFGETKHSKDTANYSDNSYHEGHFIPLSTFSNKIQNINIFSTRNISYDDRHTVPTFHTYNTAGKTQYGKNCHGSSNEENANVQNMKNKQLYIKNVIEILSTLIGIRVSMIDVFVSLRQSSLIAVDSVIQILDRICIESIKVSNNFNNISTPNSNYNSSTSHINTNNKIDCLLVNAVSEAMCVKKMLLCRSFILSGQYENAVLSTNIFLDSLNNWASSMLQMSSPIENKDGSSTIRQNKGSASLHWMRRCCVRWHRVLVIIYGERRLRLQQLLDPDIKTTQNEITESITENIGDNIEAPVSMHQKNLLRHSGTLKLSIDQLFAKAANHFYYRSCLLVVGFYPKSRSFLDVNSHFTCPPKYAWNHPDIIENSTLLEDHSFNNFPYSVGISRNNESMSSNVLFASSQMKKGRGVSLDWNTEICGGNDDMSESTADSSIKADLSSMDLVVMSSSTVYTNNSFVNLTSSKHNDSTESASSLKDQDNNAPCSGKPVVIDLTAARVSSNFERDSVHIKASHECKSSDASTTLDSCSENDIKYIPEADWISKNIGDIEHFIRKNYCESPSKHFDLNNKNKKLWGASKGSDSERGDHALTHQLTNEDGKHTGLYVFCPVSSYPRQNEIFSQQSNRGILFLVFSVTCSPEALKSNYSDIEESLVESLRNVAIVMRGEDLFSCVGKSLVTVTSTTT